MVLTCDNLCNLVEPNIQNDAWRFRLIQTIKTKVYTEK